MTGFVLVERDLKEPHPMELVILNVGLEIGVLSSSLFTMMVIMAVVTTTMTTPLLRIVRRDLPPHR